VKVEFIWCNIKSQLYDVNKFKFQGQHVSEVRVRGSGNNNILIAHLGTIYSLKS